MRRDLLYELGAFFFSPGAHCEPGEMMRCRGNSELSALPLGIEQILPFRWDIFGRQGFFVIRGKNDLVGEGKAEKVLAYLEAVRSGVYA